MVTRRLRIILSYLHILKTRLQLTISSAFTVCLLFQCLWDRTSRFKNCQWKLSVECRSCFGIFVVAPVDNTHGVYMYLCFVVCPEKALYWLDECTTKCTVALCVYSCNLRISNTGRQTAIRPQSAKNRTMHNKRKNYRVAEQDKEVEMSKPVISKTTQ